MSKKRKAKAEKPEKPEEEKEPEKAPEALKRPGLKVGEVDPSAAREFRESYAKALEAFEKLRGAARELALRHGYVLAFPDDKEQWFPYGRGEDVLAETALIKRDSDKLFRLTIYADGSAYVEPM